MPARTPSVLILGHAPLALWQRMIDDVVRAVRAGHGRPELLGQPVRVLVSSQTLRDRLLPALLDRLGGAALGLRVHTLWGLAREVAERMGAAPPSRSWLLPLAVHRALGQTRLLRRSLADLDAGWRPLMATLRDLHDAGLEPGAVAEAAIELVGDLEGAPPLRREAAEEVLAAAAAVAVMEGDLGVVSRAEVYRTAAALLAGDPDAALPTRACFVFGVPNATGRVADLIETLARCLPTTLYLDEPADPVGDGRPDAWASAFVRRLRERLGGVCDLRSLPAGDPPILTAAFSAGGPEEEIREVARRVRALLEAGTPAEAIAVVCRRLDSQRSMGFRTVFREQGLPFAGPEMSAEAHPHGRRVEALLRFLRAGLETGVDTWFDAFGFDAFEPGTFGPPSSKTVASEEILRFALKAAGAATVGQAAALATNPRIRGRPVRLPMPVTAPEEGQGLPGRAAVPPEVMEPLWRLAMEAEALAGAVPEQAPLRDHLAWMDRVIRRHLGWSEEEPPGRHLLRRLEDAREEAPPDLLCDTREASLVAEALLSGLGAFPSGGRGGGIRLLSAEQVRGAAFEAIFLCGVERGVFPAAPTEDPLLPDPIRAQLRAILPDLPLKRESTAEERYLFAHILGLAPRVTLSWSTATPQGRPTTVSPFVERLRISGPSGAEIAGAAEIPAPFPLRANPRDLDEGLWTPAAGAVVLGVAGCGPWIAPLWATLLEADVQSHGPADRQGGLEAELRLRAQILTALEAPPAADPRHGPALLAPWLGAVGPSRQAMAPSRTRWWASRLEGVARCPWQAFLRRELRLEPPLEALSELPDIDARILGETVHAAVARILQPSPLAVEAAPGLLTGPTWLVAPPSPTDLAGALRSAAQDAVRREGIPYPEVMGRALMARAEPYLEAAVDALWMTGPSPGAPIKVRGVEREGACTVPWRGRAEMEVDFRADAVLLRDRGHLVLDLKTGATPTGGGRTAETRARRLDRAMRRGSWLQGALYASAPSGDIPLLGAYLFLDPRVEEEERWILLERSAGGGLTTAGDEGLRLPLSAPLDDVTRALTALWSRGLLPPLIETSTRPLAEPGPEPPERSGNRACAFCEVRRACVCGDSGQRRRLRHRSWEAWRRWEERPDHPANSLPEALIARLWRGDLSTHVHLDPPTPAPAPPGVEEGSP